MVYTEYPQFDLHVMEIQGPSQKREVIAACKDIQDFYKSEIAETPPIGPRPVFLYQSKDGWPRARYDGLPDRYFINLTCLDPYTAPSQIVYQFAHELGHVYMWPSDFKRIINWIPQELPDLKAPWNNWFVESCCCALSFLSLSKMDRIWRLSRKRQFLINRSNKLDPSSYRNQEIQKSLKEMGISPQEDLTNWIYKELPHLANECSTEDKKEHKICAIKIEEILKKYPNSWGALCQLGNATENPITDFDKWRNLVSSNEGCLVIALSQVFRL